MPNVVGIAWYRPEQWQRLLDVPADAGKLESTHAEWVIQATRTLKRLRRNGVDVGKIEVDVEDLIGWCDQNQRNLDGSARADYAAHQLRER